MKVIFTARAAMELANWQRHDPRIARRIQALVEAIQASPFTGIGKPEPLKHNLSGYWSRRIARQHRLVYRVTADEIRVVQCRFHYQS